METKAKRQLKLNQKQLLLKSHETILRECLDIIRLEKNKLQIEHLQLSSMIAEINIGQNKSEEATNSSTKEDKTIKYVNRAKPDTRNDVARMKVQGKGKGKKCTKKKKLNNESRSEREQNSASVDEPFSSDLEPLHLDAVTSINSQKLDLDVTSALNRMLSGSFYLDNDDKNEEEEENEDEEEDEDEEEEDCTIGDNCYSDGAENLRKRVKFDDAIPDINHHTNETIVENTVHSTGCEYNEDNVNESIDEFDFMSW